MPVAGIHIDAGLDHFLAHFQITPPTCLAELAERLSGVERVVLFQLARRDGLVLRRERSLNLKLLLRVHGGAV